MWSFLFGIVLRCLTGRSSGIVKAKLEVYSISARLYYDLNGDYVTYLWEEFGTSIMHTNLVNGVLGARFWILILQNVYRYEDIWVPFDVESAEFSTMAALRIFVDDSTMFPIVAHIPDAILKLVDPKNSILVQCLASIDSSTPTGVLPQKGEECSFKVYKAPKKKKQVKKPTTVEEEFMKEIMPSKSGVLK